MVGLARVAVFLAIIGVVALGGYVVGAHQVFPFRHINEVEVQAKALYRKFNPKEVPAVRDVRIETIFVPLEGRRTQVPVERPGAGGGMTSVGEDVVLLTHEGGLFAVRSAEQIDRLSITPPDHGFDAYLAATTSEKYSHMSHVPQDFRYNDVTYLEGPEGKALAVSYTDYDAAGECVTNVVARLPLPDDLGDIREVEAGPDDWEIMFRSQPCLPFKEQCRPMEAHMAGGRMAFAAPSTLYVANGNYNRDGLCSDRDVVQDPATDYGKVVAIDLATGAARHVSTGHRNPQGIAFDAEGGLWVVEHGARGGDELNLVREGANYGWPLATLGTAYDTSPWPFAMSYGRHDTFDPPAFAWLPSAAPSALARIDGFHPAWDGDLLVGTLVDMLLYRVRVEDGHVVFSEPIKWGQRIRYVHQHTDGQIYVWGDNRLLTILKPGEIGAGANRIAAHFDGAAYGEAEAARVKNALATCIECHSLEPGNNNSAPSLATVFGAEIASGGYDGYSPALASVGGEWTSEKLLAFIDEPAAFAPGTTMPDPGISDPFVAQEVVGFLEALKGPPPTN